MSYMINSYTVDVNGSVYIPVDEDVVNILPRENDKVYIITKTDKNKSFMHQQEKIYFSYRLANGVRPLRLQHLTRDCDYYGSVVMNDMPYHLFKNREVYYHSNIEEAKERFGNAA